MFTGLVIAFTVKEAEGSRADAVNADVTPYDSPSFCRMRLPRREDSVPPPNMKLPIRKAA